MDNSCFSAIRMIRLASLTRLVFDLSKRELRRSGMAIRMIRMQAEKKYEGRGGRMGFVTPPPTFLQPYFWNVDIEALDVDRNAHVLVTRVLALGDERAVRWLNETYPSGTIRSVLKSSREFPTKTAMYWAKFYDVPPTEVRCLQPDFQNPQEPRFQTAWALRSFS